MSHAENGWRTTTVRLYDTGRAETLTVNWKLGETYAPLAAQCNDDVDFVWNGTTPHGVASVDSSQLVTMRKCIEIVASLSIAISEVQSSLRN